MFRCRLFLAALSLAALAACKPPVTPPGTLKTAVVTVTNSAGATNCQYTLAWGGTRQISEFGVASATFTVPESLVNADEATATCIGFAPGGQSPASLLSNRVTITLVALPPPVAPLPAPASRDTLTHSRDCFQGIPVHTAQLGDVGSWGPDVWMLTSLADRQAVYQAYKAAGCTGIVVDVAGTYQESGVAYPGGLAQNNDYTNDLATLCDRLAEIRDNGLYFTLALGGDNDGPTFDYVYANLQRFQFALSHYNRGDLTNGQGKFLLGFDSVDELAVNGGQNIDALILFARQVLGDRAVLVKENQTGWAFWSGGLTGAGGADCYTSPAGQALDVIWQEFAYPPGPPAAAPTILSGTWDPEHGDYAGVWSSDPTPWNQIWQVASRTVHRYTAPPNEPFDVVVPVTGGPNAGGTAAVSADAKTPPTYTKASTPRGPLVIIAAEYDTYGWVRNQVSAADVARAGAYFLFIGYDQVAGPVPVGQALSLLPALRAAAHRVH